MASRKIKTTGKIKKEHIKNAISILAEEFLRINKSTQVGKNLIEEKY